MKPVCDEAGLGSLLEAFTTNASETVNSIIEFHVSYQPNQLMELTEKLSEAIDEQEELREWWLGKESSASIRSTSNFKFLRTSGSG